MNESVQTSDCLACGKKLVGRTDKKFCDAYCRNSYNNKTKRADELYIKKVNQAIRRNRRILKSLCPIGKATIRREVLDTVRYQYQHFTSVYKPKNGTTYYICYDYAFAPVTELNKYTGEKIQKVLIVQKQDYMDAIPPLWG